MNYCASYHSLVLAATDELGSRLEAELLLTHLVGHNRSWLYAHGNEACDTETGKCFRALVSRRLSGEPIAYLTGKREFYGRDFAVSTDVLIPRPETELLIDLALKLPLPEHARVIDLGTGSGCIALTLAAEHPGWRITASDLSAAALTVAKANRKRLNLEQIELLEGDLLSPVTGRTFDLVISNPPYVAPDDHHLVQGDLRFEPANALAADDGGLAMIRRIVNESPPHLAPGGWVVLEHGFDQAAAVRLLLAQAGFENISSHNDLAGIERATLAQFL